MLEGDERILLQSDYLADFRREIALHQTATALLIIDMQYAAAWRDTGLGSILRERGKASLGEWLFQRLERVVIPNVQELLTVFRRHNLRIVYTTLGSIVADYSDISPHLRPIVMATENRRGHRNHEILEPVRPRPGEVVLNKTTSSAFASTGVDALLRAWGIRQLLLTGVATNGCVESTGRDAADMGYECVLVEDACSCAKEEYHRATLINIERIFGRVTSTKAIVFELERVLR